MVAPPLVPILNTGGKDGGRLGMESGLNMAGILVCCPAIMGGMKAGAPVTEEALACERLPELPDEDSETVVPKVSGKDGPAVMLLLLLLLLDVPSVGAGRPASGFANSIQRE